LIKKLVSLLISASVILFSGITTRAERSVPIVSAKSSILVDRLTGEVLFEKSADTRLSMASTTKILTCVIALESGKLNEIVEVDSAWVRVEGTSLGLAGGDRISLYDLCVGLMLTSGNDAANVIAFFLSGSLESFAVRMNIKARSIGMSASSFVTPSGLDAQEHYTTARDMALLASYAMCKDEFRRIVSLRSFDLTMLNSGAKRTVYTHNKLLTTYEGCTGIKTGYTKKSGRCLVSSVKRGSAELICVTLSAPDDWNDHKKLFDYGFALYTECDVTVTDDHRLRVVGGMNTYISVRCAKTVLSLTETGHGLLQSELLLPVFEYSPVSIGDTVGKVLYTVNGNIIAESPVVAVESAPFLKRSYIEKKKNYGDCLASLVTGRNLGGT